MCQAPVGKVTNVDGGMLTVTYKKGTRNLRSKLADIKPGDYVIFSMDIAIDKIDEEEALQIIGGE